MCHAIFTYAIYFRVVLNGNETKRSRWSLMFSGFTFCAFRLIRFYDWNVTHRLESKTIMLVQFNICTYIIICLSNNITCSVICQFNIGNKKKKKGKTNLFYLASKYYYNRALRNHFTKKNKTFCFSANYKVTTRFIKYSGRRTLIDYFRQKQLFDKGSEYFLRRVIFVVVRFLRL